MRLVAADLLDRPVYGFRQMDRVLALGAGTTARSVDGYPRGGRTYDPVVRETKTGSELVTWGEFVEVRLLAEFRDADVPDGVPASDRAAAPQRVGHDVPAGGLAQ